jgi:phenylacetate-CoA ligase
MFIVSGVNIFPSDVEFVIRGLDGITGEYLIRVSEKNYTARYAVEIEKARDNPETDEQLSERVSSALKARIGVKPAGITVLQDGELPRATHKAKRLIDERSLSFNI